MLTGHTESRCVLGQVAQDELTSSRCRLGRFYWRAPNGMKSRRSPFLMAGMRKVRLSQKQTINSLTRIAMAKALRAESWLASGGVLLVRRLTVFAS